jgi:hypothetical protein
MTTQICYFTRAAAEQALRESSGRNFSDLFNAEVVHCRTCGFFHIRWPRARRDALVVIKREALRIGRNGTRAGHLFAERLFRALPELGSV